MITRTTDQILSAALDRLVRETNISVTSPGSVARTWFEIMAEDIAYNYRIADANEAQLLISEAGGQGLDYLGALFGVERRESTSVITGINEGRVYFYLNSSSSHTPGTSDIANSGAAINIPVGTVVSTQDVGPGANPVSFVVAEAASIDTDSYMTYVSITPVQSLVNTIGEGTLVYHSLDVENLYVYNRLDVEVSNSSESDTNYRFRIAAAINASAKANTLALRLAAIGSTGIRNARVVPLAYGIGTVKVVITLEDPTAFDAATIFSTASAAVQESSACGDIVTCVRPAETLVGIQAMIIGDNITQRTKTNVKNAIVRYLARLDVGDPFVPTRLLGEIMNISPDIRDFAIIDGGFTLNGTPAVFSRTDSQQDEQFYTTENSIVVN